MKIAVQFLLATPLTAFYLIVHDFILDYTWNLCDLAPEYI